MDTTNEQNSQALTTTTTPKAVVPINSRGLVLADLDSLWRFSTAVAKSGLAPKGIQSPEAICVAIQMGLEVGLTPMAALQNIAVINGRPSLWGDAQLAVVRGTGELEEFEEWYEHGSGRLPRNPVEFTDTTIAVCRVKRRGYTPREVGFSVADAKRAGLWTKDGPWKQYPARMLKMRARAFALRDEFGDALRGMRCAEEQVGAIDIEASVAEQSAFTPPATESAPAQLSAETPKPRRGRPRKVQAEPEPEPEPITDPPVELPADEATTEPAPAEIIHPTLVEEPLSPQEQLGNAVREGGFTFDQFAKWAGESGWIKDADSLPGWEAVPRGIAERLLKSVTGLLIMLRKNGGVA